MIESINFSLLSPKMLKKLAAIEITKPELYDNDGFPLEGGVMDPHLGVIDPGLKCRTCGQGIGNCFGHFGYIELTKPVINVLYAKLIYKMLKMACKECGRVISKSATTTIKKCPYCGTEHDTIKFQKPYSYRVENKDSEEAIFLTNDQIRERLEKIPDEELEVFELKGGRPEWLLLTLFPVPPVLVRPSITLESGDRSEDDLTHKLVDIIRINSRLRENIEIGAPEFIIQDLWELLQYHAGTFFDNKLAGIPAARHRSGRPLKTLSERLKSKEGRFRQNLTGKRVNFAARTVISPDPFISINEVGVPLQVAKELTMPVYVQKHNLNYVKKLINNVPAWPSVNYVIRPDGKRKKVTAENKEEVIEELSPGYTINRHLQNGDIVLFNRQPSLHRMSIMAHKVVVTPWKTFTLNISAVAPYNADFDGDEMNLHVLQNEEAQIEAKMLMAVQKHIRSPRFGGPIIGCEHDHISGCTVLTDDKTKLTRREVFNLLQSINLNVDIGSKKNYTGKEVFSFLLPKGLNVEFKGKICGCEKCVKGKCERDGYIVINNGKLERGIIDAKAIGREKGKLIDVIEKQYGYDAAHTFIDKVSMLAIRYLDMHGFTVGLDDVDLPKLALEKVEANKKKLDVIINSLIEDYRKGKIKPLPGRDVKATLEGLILKEIGKTTEDVGKIVEESVKDNCAIIMIKSGARGSMTHLIQLSSMFGQARVLGQRVHRGYSYSKRTLSHFKEGDLTGESHGLIMNSFRHGLNPFEFFFNVMSGRGSLMDTSLRTRHSGYLERRLMNAMQDLKIEYDYTVRDNRKVIIQFTPGEDKIDPAKSDWGTLDIKSIVKSVIR